jgi:hypothetical protein
MTSQTGRLYALALALLLFFLAWAVVAAHPWAASSSTGDPRLRALAAREAQLRHEATLVRAVVTARQAAYHAQLDARRQEIAALKASARRLAVAAPAAPAPVRVVNLPPLTITRTS